MSDHKGIRIPTDEKIALADEIEAVVQAAIAPITARLVAQNACPCCVGRAVAAGLMKLMGYHAAPGVGNSADMEVFLRMVGAAVGLGQAQRLAEHHGVDDGSLEYMPTSGRPS